MTATDSDRPTTLRGRPVATTHGEIEEAVFQLFADRGFEATTLDDIAREVGVSRRTLFRYFGSKNDIPWGQFDRTLADFRTLLDAMPEELPLREAVFRGVMAFNDFPDDAEPPHRDRMRLILETPALQAHSVLRYREWRQVICEYVARRRALDPDDAGPAVRDPTAHRARGDRRHHRPVLLPRRGGPQRIGRPRRRRLQRMSLPPGFRVRLAGGIHRADGDRLLVGGSPLTAMRVAAVGEDVDLVWRLVARGHRVRYDPAVRAHHDARPTLGSWLSPKGLLRQRGAALAVRHGDTLAPAVLSPAYAVAAAALLLRRRWAAPVAALALAHGWWKVRANLPDSDETDTVAARLAVRGLGWAVRQEAALLLRHWWPLASLVASRSSNVRRAVVSALVVDAAVLVAERRGSSDRLDLLSVLVGRRLDDAAYGTGLWWGAIRARSPRVLLPRRPGRR